MKELQTVIGLETHVQLNTKSKLFCGCTTDAVEPNTATCTVCLGHPGSKPVLNKAALEMALRVAIALNCKINSEFFFSRKTYFYPDLAKNFQITQYEVPIGENGFVILPSGKKIRITRVHLEEDPAALVHESGMQSSSFSLVDYNRSGIPLIEIVSEPDLQSPAEAREYLNALLSVLDYLDVFVLGKQALKADANLSLKGSERVEIKNVTGFKAVEQALSSEEKRQRALLESGKKVLRETRGFDDQTLSTFSLREKETEADYGYVLEPDLPRVFVDKKWLDSLKVSIPELAHQMAARFEKQFKISRAEANVLCSDKALADLFVQSTKTVDAVLAARFLSRELLAILNHDNLVLKELALDSKEVSFLLKLLQEQKVSEKNAKEAMIKYANQHISPKEFLEKNNLLKDLGEKELLKTVESVLAKNEAALQELKSGNKKALNFLVGLVMRETKGKAEAREIQKIIEDMI